PHTSDALNPTMSGQEASTSTSITIADANQYDGRKRAHRGDDGSKPAKRQKQLSKEERQQVSFQKDIARLRELVANLKNCFEEYGLVDNPTRMSINNILPSLCTVILENPPRATTLKVLLRPISTLEDNESFQRLDSPEQENYGFSVQSVNDQLEKVANVYKEMLEDEQYPPSASHYATPAVWAKWQGKETAILNLRPSTNQGLPLSTLNLIFSRFYATFEQQPSEVVAMQVAHNLCVTMASSFKDERARGGAFVDCVRPMFNGYDFRTEVEMNSSLERHSSKAGLVLVHGIREVLGGEYKLECGTGDAYMQISRVYQTWINHLKDTKSLALDHGAPLILICVMGPVFIVSGGFYDGSSVIVEPLAQPCLMLPDYRHRRQSQLASMLLAVKEAVEGLWQVYPSFTSFENRTIGLKFESRLVLTKDSKRDLLFLATCEDSPQRVLVKLVTDDHYGVDVHRKLADAGYAPTLFGMAEVDGGPTAYVMEYLAPEDGWTILVEYLKQHNQGMRSRVIVAVGHILDLMESNEIVHGDLRPNNIMVRENQGKLELKVVDFDWAGASGAVTYPFRRNENITWPAAAGDPIVAGHDRLMVETCLNEKVNKRSI
ncbi:5647_t:CDS:2, partial [Acaulospora colombiana]